jgi:GDSL-like Lipase/Acylhydrolase family
MRKPTLRWPAALVTLAVALAGCSAASGGTGPGHPSPSPSARRSTVPVAQRTGSASQPPAQSHGSVRIMVVGDSITHGSAGDYTWQYWLYEHLRSDGIRPEMVGPTHWLWNNVSRLDGNSSYANPHFGRANDTTWGMTLSGAKTSIAAAVATYRPDYLLVLLGLDDLFWYGASQPTMAANLVSFISAARSAQPRIRFVFGLIPPDIHTQTARSFAKKVAAYNKSVVITARQLSSAESPIAVARDTDINVAADLWDGTHPNANGEIRIAAAFADALAARFHLGATYPTPFPVEPTGPLIHPKLTVTPSLTHGQVKLSWTLAPGANGYFVYLRKITAGQAKFIRLPYPLPITRDPFTAGLLSSGATYAFKVQACKGSDCGAFSNVVTITAP